MNDKNEKALTRVVALLLPMEIYNMLRDDLDMSPELFVADAVTVALKNIADDLEAKRLDRERVFILLRNRIRKNELKRQLKQQRSRHSTLTTE